MLFGTEIRGDRAAELHGCLLSVVAVADSVATDFSDDIMRSIYYMESQLSDRERYLS